MSIENITNSHGMQDIASGEWLSVFDGRDFYRVNVQKGRGKVYNSDNVLVKDDEKIKEIINEVRSYNEETK